MSRVTSSLWTAVGLSRWCLSQARTHTKTTHSHTESKMCNLFSTHWSQRRNTLTNQRLRSAIEVWWLCYGHVYQRVLDSPSPVWACV